MWEETGYKLAVGGGETCAKNLRGVGEEQYRFRKGRICSYQILVENQL